VGVGNILNDVNERILSMETPSKPVDDQISAVPGNWKFDEQVCESFDSHVRKSVPFYDEIQRLVVELSEFFVHDGSRIYDVGSSTGETLSLLARKHANKSDTQFVGMDVSLPMVAAARKKCAELPNVNILHQDATLFSRFERADYVLSLYVLQFLDRDDRFGLVNKVHDDLRVGGALIYVDKLYAEHSILEHMWNDLHWDFKKGQGLSDEMILEKARSLRGVLKPMTLRENVTMLRNAGFTTVDVFFKWMNWAGFLAIKTEPTATVSPAAGETGREEQ